jgi:hypothetical protein
MSAEDVKNAIFHVYRKVRDAMYAKAPEISRMSIDELRRPGLPDIPPLERNTRESVDILMAPDSAKPTVSE